MSPERCGPSAHPGPASPQRAATRASPAELASWDHRYLWHPFTQMREWRAEEPLIVAAAEGSYLIDIHGRRYLDGVASLWCNVHGHRHPAIDASIRAQLDRVAHSTLLGLASVPSIQLARALVERAPQGLTRVFYSDDGATAVEVALRMALQYWQLAGAPERTRFASLVGAYHGDTLGAMAVGFSEDFHRFYRPVVREALRLTPPHVFRWKRGLEAAAALEAALGEAEAKLAAEGRRLAAVIVEPLMQGAAGMWAHPVEYLQGLAELCRRAGTLLICDEVATGFGRTGKLFACEHAGISPDLLCLAKGLSGGYLPLAATLATDDIFSAFLGTTEERRAFFHGHTYTGNALGCAAALASLEVFDREGTLAALTSKIERLARRLARDIAPLEHVGDVRQWGFMVGIELVRDRARRTPYDPPGAVGRRVVSEARRRGVVLRPLGDVIVLMPPLAIAPSDLDRLCDVVAESIQAATAS